MYMAPEQFGFSERHGTKERIGPAVDIWALGVVLYELLAGQRPFGSHGPGDLRRAIRDDDPPGPRSIRPLIPPGLEAIVLKCLAKSPADRYARAGDLADDLARWLAGDAPSVYPDGAAGKLQRFVRRRSTLAVLIGLTFVAGGAGLSAAITAYRNDPEREREGIEKTLAAGKQATLLADRGPSRIQRVPIGAGEARLSTETDRPFFVSTHGVALVELWPNPPEHYRFEVEMRHDANPAFGALGLFFDYYEPGFGVNQPSCYIIRFTDRGSLARHMPPAGGLGARVGLTFQHFELNGQEASLDKIHRIDEQIIHTPDAPGNAPSPWRRLRIDVGPKAIAIHWFPGAGLPDQHVRIDDSTILERVRIAGIAFPELRGYPGRPAQRGSLGLYVNSSTASFRNATLERLDVDP